MTESTTKFESNEPLFSKRDWGKLEFPTAPKAEVKTTGEKVEIAKTDVVIEDSKAKVAKTEVAVTKSETVIKPAAFDKTAAGKASSVKATTVTIDLESEEAEEPVAKSDEPKVITVSDLNKHIRSLLEGKFPLLWLKGEISNFKAHTSGHFYFSLKDSKSQISAVMFRGFNSALKFRPSDGMEVIIRGKVTVFEPRGNYQIFCEMMEPVGAGALQKAYEQLKAKLDKEGLFAAARKRPLPTLPKHIAIVTSPTGAAIRDMLNVLGRRFKGANITVVPCKVQGESAKHEIVAAIKLACRLPDVDVMIVGRGGGSIEDLWAFNEEIVARAIAEARVPVISAVGHEVDFTIADFVADLRAPTPSAAAELVVKNAADLIERVKNIQRALKFSVLRNLNSAKQIAVGFSKRLVDPQRRIQDASQRCDELMQRLEAGAGRLFKNRHMQIELLNKRLGTPIPRLQRHCQMVANYESRMKAGLRNLHLRKREAVLKNMALLDSLSPLKVLDRGYSMVITEGSIVTDATSLKPGQHVTVRMCKGSIEAQVTKVDTER